MIRYILINERKFRVNSQPSVSAERALREAGIEEAEVWAANYETPEAAKAAEFAGAYKTGAIVHSHRTCERCGNSHAHRPKEEVHLVGGGTRLQCKCECRTRADAPWPDHAVDCPAEQCQYAIDTAELEALKAAEEKNRWGF